MDWLKVEKATRRKLEVLQIANLLSISRPDAFDLCLSFWEWAEEQTLDGTLPGISADTIDAIVARAGFSHALLSVGWLQARSDSLVIPNFARHMGQGAKQRALTARRKVRERSRSQRDKSVTREEKKREENKDPPTPGGGLFELFWQSFPKGRKHGKEKARKAFAAASKKVSPETLIAAAKEYAASPVGQGQYVKAPESWLNAGCWDDDRAAWRRSDRNGHDPAPRDMFADAAETAERLRKIKEGL